MLNAISWQQYLTVAALLLLAWYIYVGLRYYRPELASWGRFPRPSETQLSVVHQSQAPVMGAAQPEIGTAVHDPEDLLFADNEPDDISDATIPSGPADEFLAEAKMLIDAFREATDKIEFLALFKVLVEKYAVYGDEIDLEAALIPIKDFAAAKLPFSLADTDWPAAFPPV